MLALGIGAGYAHAQASDGDKDFLKYAAQDSNFEIKTGQLALQKSSSADVKAYATMVIHDHRQLERELKTAFTAAKADPPSAGSMSVGDDARYAELKLLSGETFDKSYIKGLAKGNQESTEKGKAEVGSASIPVVKTVAEREVALDAKHTKRAEALAQAHHIDAQ